MSHIITVKQSIGKLRQINTILNSSEADSKFIADNSFCAVYRNINSMPSYGRIFINELTIYNNGEENLINLNGYTFDSCIGYEEHYTANSNTYRQKFKLVGKTPNGEIFELEFRKMGPEILSYVVYAMIFTTYVGIDNVCKYWNYLDGSVYFMQNLTLDEQILCIRKLSNVAKQCIKEYPFMEYLFQKGFKEMKKEVIDNFNSWNALK